MKYPNEILETPMVFCEPERLVIKIKTTSSNPSHIYAENLIEDAECAVRNQNRIAIPVGKCGMTSERTDNPMGMIERICVTVQLHPLFVTESDRSYCAQCVYVENQVLEDFEQTLAISEHQATELDPQFDFEETPTCSYTIRKDSKDGPEAHYASVGERVFHVWSCESATAGILIQNCYVEDGQGNRILIIDQNGCGVDHYVMATPNYSPDLTSAFQETHVFKFAQKTITRFTCQIRICYKGKDCSELSPPRACPSLEERLAMVRQLRDQPSYEKKDIYLSLKELEKDIQKQPFPFPKPPRVNFTAESKGKIYFNGNTTTLRRERRALEYRIEKNVGKVLKSEYGYPMMDVKGELRVLDTPEDAQYYESVGSASKSDDCSSKSSFLFPIIIACLIVTSLLLFTFVLLITRKSNSRPKESSWIAT
ncbi:unnamed protein product, partial [Mesorhabditis belari]|uniref:ZP domain-containing protein n=1 Tax=Mesorhabditis belari TaxID=2138241 RepID=A0AAF3EF09_9BILA